MNDAHEFKHLTREQKIARFAYVASVIKSRYRLLPSREMPARPEDIYAVAITGIIKAIDSYDPDKGAKLVTHVTHCANNAVLDYIRSSRYAKKKQVLEGSKVQEFSVEEFSVITPCEEDAWPMYDSDSWINTIPSNDESIDTIVQKSQDRDELYRLIPMLPEEERKVVELRLTGLRFEEIDREIGTDKASYLYRLATNRMARWIKAQNKAYRYT